MLGKSEQSSSVTQVSFQNTLSVFSLVTLEILRVFILYLEMKVVNVAIDTEIRLKMEPFEFPVTSGFSVICFSPEKCLW